MQDRKICIWIPTFALHLIFYLERYRLREKTKYLKKEFKNEIVMGGKSFKSQVCKGDPGLTPPK